MRPVFSASSRGCVLSQMIGNENDRNGHDKEDEDEDFPLGPEQRRAIDALPPLDPGGPTLTHPSGLCFEPWEFPNRCPPARGVVERKSIELASKDEWDAWLATLERRDVADVEGERGGGREDDNHNKNLGGPKEEVHRDDVEELDAALHIDIDDRAAIVRHRSRSKNKSARDGVKQGGEDLVDFFKPARLLCGCPREEDEKVGAGVPRNKKIGNNYNHVDYWQSSKQTGKVFCRRCKEKIENHAGCRERFGPLLLLCRRTAKKLEMDAVLRTSSSSAKKMRESGGG